jgi:diguanylate cyclase (GGDEF)-like protein/hemerythrin-like metal-binding protein
MKQLLMNLVQIGNQNDYSGAKQRTIQLTNILAIAGMLGSLGFALLFLSIDPNTMFPPASLGLTTVFLLIFVFLLNMRKQYELASVWLLLAISIPVFINLRIYLGFRTGYHIFFILFSLLPVLLFSQRRWFLVILFSGINLSFFFLTYRYIPSTTLVAALSKSLLTGIENITVLFVLVSIIAIFWFNHRISDMFEKDLVEKKKNLEMLLLEVRKFSTLDALTEILNRGHMEQRINDELTRGYRYGFPISIVMYDLDNFKRVNDVHGHDVGDIVLKKSAAIVKSSIRETDALGRWGGEEFMILLPYTNEAIADKIAKKLCKLIEETDFGEYGRITASFGVVQWDGIENFERLYKRIDRALYAAKERGRNQVVTDTLMHGAKQPEPKYYWKAEWESGNGEIDRQHRRLVESLASFLNGEDKIDAVDFVDLLTLDLAAHFEFEENLLVKIGYLETDQHKSSHKKLMRWMKNLRSEITVGQGEFNQHSVHILAETVVNHMLEEDVKYYPSLR